MVDAVELESLPAGLPDEKKLIVTLQHAMVVRVWEDGRAEGFKEGRKQGASTLSRKWFFNVVLFATIAGMVLGVTIGAGMDGILLAEVSE